MLQLALACGGQERSEPSSSSPTGTSPIGTSPSKVPGLTANIEGQPLVFDESVRTDALRPPAVEVYAHLASTERSLRVFILPSAAQTKLTPGPYECDGKGTHVWYWGTTSWDTTETGGACRIELEDAGTEPGQVLSGRFEATVVKSQSTESLVLEDGTFYGVIE